MKTLNCDICRNIIQAPVSGRNYFHKAHRDLCEFCHDKLELLLKPIVRTKRPFDYVWFNKLLQESIETAVKKGRVEVK